MGFSAENILLIGSILLFISVIVSKAGYRFGVPSLLLFLCVGMLFGSDGFGVEFHNPTESQFIGIITLSVILFTGGMDTKLSDIKPVLSQGLLLSTVGVLLTMLFTGFFIYWISGMQSTSINLSLTVSLLLAATMASTDSASVFNILRSQNVKLKNNLGHTLELESGSNDPMAYMLTIILIRFLTVPIFDFWDILAMFLIQFTVGAALGYLLGRAVVFIINKINLPNLSLYPLLLLSFIFFTFTVTDLFGGNGYLAVYIAGVVVGNAKVYDKKEITTFMGGMTWLCQIVMFLTLGLLVNPFDMIDIAAIALLIGLFLIVIARPLSVILCLLPFRKVDMKSQLFLSWVGLRGAVPIIFATYPVVANVEGANQIFNIVFFITILSLVLQGTTVSFLAKLLHLTLPADDPKPNFGVELSDDTKANLDEMIIQEEHLLYGNTLSEIVIPEGRLVILIKRGGSSIVPNGTIEIKKEDVLLLISKKQ